MKIRQSEPATCRQCGGDLLLRIVDHGAGVWVRYECEACRYVTAPHH